MKEENDAMIMKEWPQLSTHNLQDTESSELCQSKRISQWGCSAEEARPPKTFVPKLQTKRFDRKLEVYFLLSV